MIEFLRDQLRGLIRERYKPWPGMEFCKVICGRSFIAGLAELGCDPDEECKTAFADVKADTNWKNDARTIEMSFSELQTLQKKILARKKEGAHMTRAELDAFQDEIFAARGCTNG